MAGDRRAGQHHRASRGPAELTGQAAVGEPVRCRGPTRPPAEMSRCAPSAEGDGGAWPWGSWNEKKNTGRFGRIEESGNSTAGGLGGGDARVPRDRRGLQAALAGARDVEAGTGPEPRAAGAPGRGGDWLAATRPLSIEFPVFLLFSSMLLRDALRPAPCPRPWPLSLPLQSGLLLLPLHLSLVYIIFEEPRSPWGHLPRPLQRRGTPLPRVPVSPVVGSSLEQVQ